MGRGGKLRVSPLPENADLREVLAGQDHDVILVADTAAVATRMEIIRQIRTITASLPIIFMDGAFDAGHGVSALEAGADYYLWDTGKKAVWDLLIPIIRNLVLHRRIEERLYQDNLFMRAIHDASPIAACVIRDHRILRVNAIIPRKLGYTEQELIDADPTMLFPDDEEHHRIDAGLFEGTIEEGWGMVEGVLKRKDGTLISCQLLSRPVDPDDRGKGRIIIGQDITDYVRMRDLLRKSEVQ